MANVRVRLQPLVQMINLPTVLKTATLPGDTAELLSPPRWEKFST